MSQNNVNIDYLLNNERHNYLGGTKRARAHVCVAAKGVSVCTLEDRGIINTNLQFFI